MLMPGVSFQSRALGVVYGTRRGAIEGAKIDAVSSVGSTDAASRQLGAPEGIAVRLQVSANIVEPREASRSANLFPKER